MFGPMTVRSYDLYGEPEESFSFGDVLHCESIAARSLLHDWSFAAHRHARLHQFFWITRGGGRVVLDGLPQGFGPHCLIFIPRLTVHGFAFSPGTIGWVVSVPADPALPVPEAAQLLRIGGVADPAQLTGLFAQIAEEYGRERIGRAALLGALAVSLAVWVLRAAEARPPAPESRQRRLVRRFTGLVEDHFRAHWPVERYAEALAVTPTHLSRVCREVCGRPASALIQDRLLLEARRQLALTDLPVSAIAYELGFADPAYFSRVFRAGAGRAPKEFRAAARGRAAVPSAPPPAAAAAAVPPAASAARAAPPRGPALPFRRGG